MVRHGEVFLCLQLAIRRPFVYSGFVSSVQISARTGRKGGRARTAAKSLAARQNVLLRWHPADRNGVIPVPGLIDGAWYLGEGRSASIAYWDAVSKTFHTVAANSWSDPTSYPQVTRRTVRLKQERHVQSGGTFAPRKILAGAAS